MIRKVFTWAPLLIVLLIAAMALMSFSFREELMQDNDPITKDGSISAGWVLAGLSGCTVALLMTIFLFAWRVIQMQGVTLNKTTSMQSDMQVRMKVLEEICLPSHLPKKGNAEKMARILRETSQQKI